MSTIRNRMTRIITGAMALSLIILPVAPLVASADMTAPDANGNSCFIVGSDQPGNHAPAGSDANLFTYNCSTNLWQSSHYTFDPITDQRSPIDIPTYTYNASTSKYDYQAWDYSAAKNDYVLTKHSTATPPAGSNIIGGPAAPTTTITNTGNGSTNTVNNNGNQTGSNSINGTGADSSNTINNNGTNNVNGTTNNGVSVTNNQLGTATTGNALVTNNTQGGNAGTGNALDEATIVNMLQSSSGNVGSGNTVSFVANIDGDVNGDLLLDPATLSNVQPASAPGDTNVTVNNSTDEAINNNVDLTALSGNANVDGNTTAGSAASGSAEAIANVVNLIDSAITSGKSFIGTININGNLNGNIMVPADFVNQLVADNVPQVTISNTGASSNNTVNNNGGQSNTVTDKTNQGINNTVTSKAQSGDAKVTGNTEAGDAKTGSANTSITAFNLTGSRVVGSNDLLVFVNVVGKWVGMIVNAPAGATAAELGGGISSNSTDASGTSNVSNTTNQQINNNINVNAQSGNANVKNNTQAGDATSGNAGTAVNLLNVENSSLSFSGWFGILFINVFGTWNGNFGVYSATVTPATPAQAAAKTTGSTSKLVSFVPTSGNSTSTTSGSGSNTNATSTTTSTPAANVLAAQTVASNKAATPQLQTASSITGKVIVIGSAVVLYIVADAYFTRRHALSSK